MGRLRVWSAELSCRLYREKSRWYFLAHEVHLLMYWWGREQRRWELLSEKDK
jgi:hypothetical protein